MVWRPLRWLWASQRGAGAASRDNNAARGNCFARTLAGNAIALIARALPAQTPIGSARPSTRIWIHWATFERRPPACLLATLRLYGLCAR